MARPLLAELSRFSPARSDSHSHPSKRGLQTTRSSPSRSADPRVVSPPTFSREMWLYVVLSIGLGLLGPHIKKQS